MTRRSNTQLDRDLRDHVTAALADVVGRVEPSSDSRGNVEIDVDGHRLVVEVKAMAYGTVDRVDALKQTGAGTGDRPVLVVAERINQPAQAALRADGWGYLDLSTGKLFLRGPGVRIDTTVDTVTRPHQSRPVGIVGRAARVLAYEILRRRYDEDPRPVLTTTSLDEFDLARSSTSDARRALVGAGLLAEDGEPMLPELFWALAGAWAPTERRWLASVPGPEEWSAPPTPTGSTWRLGGAHAASRWGAPIVTTSDGPIDLYVPGPVLLSVAVRRYGPSDPVAAAASVAVPVVHQVTAPPDRRPSAGGHHEWLLVHPVAAALDLAASGDARSLQVLGEWQPEGEAVWHDL